MTEDLVGWTMITLTRHRLTVWQADNGIAQVDGTKYYGNNA